MTVAITRADLDAAAARSKDVAASRRMLALALVLEGCNRTEAARAVGMDRQTLRDWVHRYNAEGLDGLSNRAHKGAPAAYGRRHKLRIYADPIGFPPYFPFSFKDLAWR